MLPNTRFIFKLPAHRVSPRSSFSLLLFPTNYCSLARGFITYYSDSSCRTPINARNNPLIYVLNTCFGYQSWQNTFTTQCTTTNTQTLPLPTMKDLVTFSYYQDNTCNTIVQYSAYAESICLPGYKSTSIKYIYPRKISYSNPTCAGAGVTSNLQTNTCFDWVNTYGYSDDDSFTWNADDFYMIVAESTTRVGKILFFHFLFRLLI